MNATAPFQSSNDNIFYFLISISIIGTFGNMVVAFVYWKKKDKLTSTFFILFLSFIDLIVCSILIPMIIYMEKIVFETNSIIFCKTYNFLTTTTVPSSSLLMTSIAFDRFFCICMVNRNIITYRRAKIIAFGLFTFSISLGIIPSMASVVTKNFRNQILENSTFNFSYVQCTVDMEGKQTIFGKMIIPFKFIYDALFVFCVIIITFLYIQIYKEIYRRRKLKFNQKRKLLYNSIINSGGIVNKNYLKRNENIFNGVLSFCGRYKEKKIEKCKDFNKITFKNTKAPPLTKLIQIMDSREKENQTKNNDNEYSDFIQSQPIEQGSCLNHGNQLLSNKEKKHENQLLYFSGKHVISSKDIRTAFMLFVVSCLYLIFYLPSITITYLTIFLPKISSNLYISYLYLSNSAINPIIYCFLNPVFRLDLINLFFKKGYLYDKIEKKELKK